jgi:hypothetical protein
VPLITPASGAADSYPFGGKFLRSRPPLFFALYAILSWNFKGIIVCRQNKTLKHLDFKPLANRLFAASIALLIILVFCFSIISRSSADSLPSTASDLRANAHKIVLRLPYKSIYESEDILVLEDPNANYQWRAIRGPSDPSRRGVTLNSYTRTVLTPTLQQGVVNLQADWCQTLPYLTPPKETDQFYKLAINCPSRNRVYQFNILPEELPEVLVKLVVFAPSPK